MVASKALLTHEYFHYIVICSQNQSIEVKREAVIHSLLQNHGERQDKLTNDCHVIINLLLNGQQKISFISR